MTHILLVEDAVDLAEVLEREIEATGFQVSHAADGTEALQMLNHYSYDLVILDWMLPGMDGLEILRRLRQKSAVPVLMLTAKGEELDRVLGLEMGADDYMTKPFSTRELVARVRALLRRAERIQELLDADHRESSQQLSWQSVILDPESHLATLDGNALELTPTEFNLLHLLMRNPGRIFSRKYLLETIWDEVYIEGDRSADNAVMRLRKKLGKSGNALEGIWGVGYRLKLPE